MGDGQESELVLCRLIMVENMKTEIALRQCSEDAQGPWQGQALWMSSPPRC